MTDKKTLNIELSEEDADALAIALEARADEFRTAIGANFLRATHEKTPRDIVATWESRARLFAKVAEQLRRQTHD